MVKGLKGGLSSGGEGIWRMGKGGELVAIGLVTPGIDGIRGGRLRPSGVAWQEAQRLAITTDQLRPGMLKERRGLKNKRVK
jgi:hypothetical protein